MVPPDGQDQLRRWEYFLMHSNEPRCAAFIVSQDSSSTTSISTAPLMVSWQFLRTSMHSRSADRRTSRSAHSVQVLSGFPVCLHMVPPDGQDQSRSKTWKTKKPF